MIYFLGNAVITFPKSSITTFNVFNGFPLAFVPIGLLNVCSNIYPFLPFVFGLRIKLSPFRVLSIPDLISKLELKWDLLVYDEFGPCLSRI